MTKKKSIDALNAQIGKIYKTKLGILVIVKKICSNGVQVVPQFSSKTLVIKKKALLFPPNRKDIKKKVLLHFKQCRERWEDQLIAENSERTEKVAIVQARSSQRGEPTKAPCPTQVRRGPKGPRGLSVTSIVDPMLFSGNHTRQQIILTLTQSEIGKTLTNKDFGWYVSYRVAVLKERGYVFEKFENEAIKLSKPAIKVLQTI